MFEMLRGLVDALAKTDAEAARHREDDREAFGVIMPALEEIKAANVRLATEVKTLGSTVAKIIPVVDELKSARDYAQTRAEVLKEIATEAAAKKEREDDKKDRADEKRSRWFGPILAAAVGSMVMLAGGWAYDHYTHNHISSATTTITSTVDRRH